MVSVSILVPNYNHASFLRKRLESIFNQTFRDFEVILLDDCSPDNSREILDEFKQNDKVTHVLFNEKNSGSPFKQWHKGLSYCKGKYVWIAESDDFSEPTQLEVLINAIEKYPSAGMAYCGTNYVTATNALREEFEPPARWNSGFFNEGKDEIFTYLTWGYCPIVNVSAVLFKKSALEKTISTILHFKRAGDWMLYVRILEQADIVYTPERLNYFRFDPAKPKINFDNYIYTSERLIILGYISKKFELKDKLDHNILRISDELIVYIKNDFRRLRFNSISQLFSPFYTLWRYNPFFAFRILKKNLF